jgi:large subunit ribosomal protein L29
MDIDKVRALSDGELEDELRQAKQDLWQARFQLNPRQLKDYSSIPQTRRKIARILTVQRERRDERSRAGAEPAGREPGLSRA